MSEVPQLFQRLRGLVLGLGEQVSRLAGGGCYCLTGQPERDPQRHELLLRAVVQVAL